MKRRIYLKMMELSKARRLLLSRFFPGDLVGEEEIDSRLACQRVLSRPVFAKVSSPGFHSAAMDGYAVLSEDTFNARDDSPIRLTIGKEAIPINTGFKMPSDKNAVIMVEHAIESEDGKTIEIRSPVFPWQNVRKVGEDIVSRELLFPTNHLLAPYDLGALLSSGNVRVWVWKRPIVAVIPTGSELISEDEIEEKKEKLADGFTIESNSSVLCSLTERFGGIPRPHKIVEDDRERIFEAVREAVDSDAHVILVNAGSSAGSADYTVEIIEALGEVLCHGITMMPGKPTIIGIIDKKPVIGIPGYPVSAVMAFEKIVAPLLLRLQGRDREPPIKVKAILSKSLPSRSGIEEFRRVIAGKVGERIVACPIKKGAGSITTLTRANGILRIPLESEGIREESLVEIELIRPWQDLDRTLIVIGSHDLSLDILKDHLKKGTPSIQMASNHVGSLGGIVAVSKGLCHMAGTHLLDEETGDYNISYIKRYVKGLKAVLVNLCYRQQGLIVQKGNPKSIENIHDLLRDDVTFVNRQKGSGTRVLLDYQLRRLGLNPSRISGYDNEEYTHMAVAVSVLSKKADCGLGILSAARALGLDFIPVVEERYDLLIPRDLWSSEVIEAVMDIINSRSFKDEVEALGGYSLRDTGRVFFES